MKFASDSCVHCKGTGRVWHPTEDRDTDCTPCLLAADDAGMFGYRFLEEGDCVFDTDAERNRYVEADENELAGVRHYPNWSGWGPR